MFEDKFDKAGTEDANPVINNQRTAVVKPGDGGVVSKRVCLEGKKGFKHEGSYVEEMPLVEMIIRAPKGLEGVNCLISPFWLNFLMESEVAKFD